MVQSQLFDTAAAQVAAPGRLILHSYWTTGRAVTHLPELFARIFACRTDQYRISQCCRRNIPPTRFKIFDPPGCSSIQSPMAYTPLSMTMYSPVSAVLCSCTSFMVIDLDMMCGQRGNIVGFRQLEETIGFGPVPVLDGEIRAPVLCNLFSIIGGAMGGFQNVQIRRCRWLVIVIVAQLVRRFKLRNPRRGVNFAEAAFLPMDPEYTVRACIRCQLLSSLGEITNQDYEDFHHQVQLFSVPRQHTFRLSGCRTTAIVCIPTDRAKRNESGSVVERVTREHRTLDLPFVQIVG